MRFYCYSTSTGPIGGLSHPLNISVVQGNDPLSCCMVENNLSLSGHPMYERLPLEFAGLLQSNKPFSLSLRVNHTINVQEL